MRSNFLEDGCLTNSLPPAPGERIREELASRGWTQGDLAIILDRPMQAVSEIIAGKKAITPETAIQLGVALGTGPDIWMQLEATYRLGLVNGNADTIARRAKLYSIAPIKDMARRNWIRETDNMDALEQELKLFFGVASFDRDPEIDAVARKSTGGDSLTPPQRAWSFRAKRLASAVQAKPYQDDGLDKCMERLRVLAAYPEEMRKVPRVLAAAGIRLVIVEPLPKSRIDGVAFWLNEKSPVIAMSLRFDRVDYFWHTLGHELSHIRHRDTSIIDVHLGGDDGDANKPSDVERRADQEAAAAWISPDEFDDFVRRVGPIYSKARINQFANRIRIHPGIIVGQLHHREKKFTTHREMLVKVRDTLSKEALTDGWGYTIADTP